MLDICFKHLLHIITSCPRPPPTKYLHVLAGIAPAHVRKNFQTYRLVQKQAQIRHSIFTTMRQPQLLPTDIFFPVVCFIKNLFTSGIPETMPTICGQCVVQNWSSSPQFDVTPCTSTPV